MITIVPGVVQEGVVVPMKPLPEGAEVEILLRDSKTPIPPELKDELAAWDRASDETFEKLEKMFSSLEEGQVNEKR